MKYIYTLLISFSLLSAEETIQKIVVEDKYTEISTKTIEEESLINEQTLDQKLFNSVNINQHQVGSKLKIISIRGNNYRATKYYEDDIELFKNGNGYTDLVMYHSSNSSIKVNSGGSQGIDGPSATGGDVYLNSKKLKSGLSGSLSTTFSTNNVYINSSLSQKNDDYYFTINLGALKENNFEISHDFTPTTIQNNYSRINSDKEQFSGSLKFGYTLNDNSDIAFKISHLQGEYGSPIQVYNEAWNPFTSNAVYNRIDDKRLTNYWFYYNYKLDDLKVKFRAYYDKYTDVLNFYTTPSVNVLDANSSRYKDERVGALISFEYKYNQDNNGKLTLKAARNRHRQIEDLDPTDEDYETVDSSISYLHNYKANEKVQVSLSAKYKQQDIIDTHDFNTTTVENYKDNRAVDGQITLNYSPTQKQSYYISLAHKNRFPSLRELFPFFTWDQEKNGLKPEKSNNIEIGTSLKTLPNTILNISVYYNDIENLMLIDSSQYSNSVSDSATMQGVELNLNNFSIKDNEFIFSYAYTKAEDSDNQQIAQVPKSKLFIQDIYAINNKIDFTASYLYSTKRYDLYNGTRYTLGSYSLVDTQLSYKSSKNLSFKAGVKNLFDSLWEFSRGQPAQGRSYFASLSYTY